MSDQLLVDHLFHLENYISTLQGTTFQLALIQSTNLVEVKKLCSKIGFFE